MLPFSGEPLGVLSKRELSAVAAKNVGYLIESIPTNLSQPLKPNEWMTAPDNVRQMISNQQIEAVNRIFYKTDESTATKRAEEWVRGYASGFNYHGDWGAELDRYVVDYKLTPEQKSAFLIGLQSRNYMRKTPMGSVFDFGQRFSGFTAELQDKNSVTVAAFASLRDDLIKCEPPENKVSYLLDEGLASNGTLIDKAWSRIAQSAAGHVESQIDYIVKEMVIKKMEGVTIDQTSKLLQERVVAAIQNAGLLAQGIAEPEGSAGEVRAAYQKLKAVETGMVDGLRSELKVVTGGDLAKVELAKLSWSDVLAKSRKGVGTLVVAEGERLRTPAGERAFLVGNIVRKLIGEPISEYVYYNVADIAGRLKTFDSRETLFNSVLDAVLTACVDGGELPPDHPLVKRIDANLKRASETSLSQLIKGRLERERAERERTERGLARARVTINDAQTSVESRKPPLSEALLNARNSRPDESPWAPPGFKVIDVAIDQGSDTHRIDYPFDYALPLEPVIPPGFKAIFTEAIPLQGVRIHVFERGGKGIDVWRDLNVAKIAYCQGMNDEFVMVLSDSKRGDIKIPVPEPEPRRRNLMESLKVLGEVEQRAKDGDNDILEYGMKVARDFVLDQLESIKSARMMLSTGKTVDEVSSGLTSRT